MKSLFIILTLLFSASSFAQLSTLKLNGNYHQQCATDDDDNSFEQYLGFSNEHLEWKFVAFEDVNCQQPYLVFKREFTIIATTDTEVQTASIISSYVSLTDEITGALNIINYCGFSDWQTNVMKDVTGKKCDDYQQLQQNEKQLFNYKIQDHQLIWNNNNLPFNKTL